MNTIKGRAQNGREKNFREKYFDFIRHIKAKLQENT